MQTPFQFPVPDIDFAAIAPLIVVALTGIFVLIVEMAMPKRNNNLIVGVALAGLAAAAALSVNQYGYGGYESFNNMVVRDGLSTGLQLVLILGTAVTIIFSEGYLRDKRIAHGEFYPLILWSTAGAMIMVSTRNLLVMFLGLEVLSVALYVMAGMSRTEEKSEESALKYFLLGAFASGFFLYGIAFAYGATGSLSLTGVGSALVRPNSESVSLLLFSLTLIVVGLGFKCSFVPFHLWTPDVYQGAPTNVTAFMASGSKVAAIGALTRILAGFSGIHQLWTPGLTVIAILTMCYGNLVALRQSDVKRMLGYSSIANAGYMLVELIAYGTDPGRFPLTTVVYYLLAYSLTTIGAFSVLTLATRGGQEGTRFADLHGLYKRSPIAAVSLVLLTASLMGFPGTAGFIGKLLIIRDAYDAKLQLLWVVLAINSVVSIAYYLGLVRAAFVSTDVDAERRQSALNPGVAWACAVCVVTVVGAGIFANPVLQMMAAR